MPINLTPEEYARAFSRGYSADTKPADRSDLFGAGVDRAQGSLLGLAESLGLPVADHRRRNEELASYGRSKYYEDNPDQAQSYKEVTPSNAPGWVANLFVESAPTMAGIAAAGLAGGVPGAVAAGSVFGVGDVLDNQREQSGRTSFASALPLGVAYGAADGALGLGGMVARRSLGTGVKAFDTLGASRLAAIQGLKGTAARTGAGMAKGGLSEGLPETFQEGMNQLGRMAVDPNQGFLDDRSEGAFAESFIAGSVMGAIPGAFHRGAKTPAKPVEDQPNLLDRPLLLGNNPTAGAYTVFPDGSVALNSEDARAHRLDRVSQDATASERQFVPPITPAPTPIEIEPAPPPLNIETQMRPLQERQLDLGELTAQQAGMDPQAQAIKEAADKLAAQREAAHADLVDKNPDGTYAVTLKPLAVQAHRQMVELRDAGVMTQAAFIERAGELRAAVETEDTEAINKIAKQIREAHAQQTAPQATGVQPIGQATADAATKNVPAGATAATGGRTQPAGVAAATENDGAVAGIDPNKKITIGRKGREVQVRVRDYLTRIAGAQPHVRQWILAATGLEFGKNATTGATELQSSGKAPLTLDEIAATIPNNRGNTVTRAAVAQALDTYGVTQDVITQMHTAAAPTEVTSEDLGLDNTENMPGYRVENELSKTTGAGLVEGEAETLEQKQNRLKADALLKAAGPSTAVGQVDDAPTNLPQGTTVRDLRNDNQGKINANIQALLQHDEAENAAADWDESRATWSNLPSAFKADFIDAYVDNLLRNEGDINFQELAREQGRIEDDYSVWSGQQATPGTIQAGDTGAGGRVGGNPQAESPRPTLGAEPPAASAKPASVRVKKKPTAQPAGVVGEGAGVSRSAQSVSPTKLAMANEAWSDLQENTPGMPAFGDLSSQQQKQVADLVSRGQFNLAAANTVAQGAGSVTSNQAQAQTDTQVARPGAEMDRPAGPHISTKESVGQGKAGSGSDREAVIREVRDFLQTGSLGSRIQVVQSAKDLPLGVKVSSKSKTQGVALQGVNGDRIAYLIADNLPPGKVRSVFMHEVGSHLGLDNRLTAVQYTKLVAQIKDWARQGAAGSSQLEHKLAIAAVLAVQKNTQQAENRRADLIAYFIEGAVESGIDPTAIKTPKTRLDAFLLKVFKLYNQLLAKLGVNASALTAQDVVDLAYGAAQMENLVSEAQDVSGETTTKFSKASKAQPMPTTGNKQLDALADRATDILSMTKDVVGDIKNKLIFTRDLINHAVTNGVSSAAEYGKQMDRVAVERGAHERKLANTWEAFSKLSKHERGTGPSSVNALLKSSTMKKVWAFKPDWLPNVEFDPNTPQAQAFEMLSKEAQAVVKDVFRSGHESLAEMRKHVLENVASEYDVLIAAAKEAGDTQEVKSLENAKLRENDRISTLLNEKRQWPYVPLKRFGKYAVVGTSDRYREVADKLSKDKTNSKLREELKDLQADPKHYYVAFAETHYQGRTMARRVEAETGLRTSHFERLDENNMLDGGRDMVSAMHRVRSVVNDLPDTTAAMRKVVSQAYVQMLSDTSVRKAEIERKNVAGADDDMMRAFISHGRAHAHFIAGLKTNGKINDLLRDMRSQTGAIRDKEARTAAQAAFVEIERRHRDLMEYKDEPIYDNLMGITSSFMLLANPSYYLMNATQPFMMTLPLMAGKFGYVNAANHLLTAYKELVPVLKDGSFDESDYAKLPADVKLAVEALANRGRINIALSSELGKARSTSNNVVVTGFDFVTSKMRGFAETVESANRLSSAIAAYRMAKQNALAAGKSEESAHAAAVDYAENVIYETHGDYSANNAPRFMRSGITRVMTQFRKFQLIQASHYAKLFKEAFDRGNSQEARDQRWLAQKVLMFNMSTLFAAGGVMGLPGFAMLSFFAGMFGDDDEPDDPEATLRRMVGDKATADLLLKGIPKLAGMDVSGRIGAGGMLSLLPYVEPSLDRNGYKDVVFGALGPAVSGLGSRMADAAGMMSSGQYWKGLEMMLPGGLGNTLKAYRLGTEGFSQRNGDVVLSSDEIGYLSALSVAFGTPSNVVSDRNFMASAKYKSEKFYTERTSSLKREYAQAYRDGDMQTAKEVRDRWQETQEARRRLGFKVQPLSELLKAPQEQRKREQSARSGVVTTKANQGFVGALQ